MELNQDLNNAKDITKIWKEHINNKIQENLKNAIKHRNENGIDEIEINDMGAIDSIEDDIVRCELLDGEMLEFSRKMFKYKIEEGDIINLKLKYRNGNIIKTEILDKNAEEKKIRQELIKERIKQMRTRR